MTRAVFLAGAALAGIVSAQSVDEIVARAIAARGGAERLRSLRSQRLTGTIAFANETPAAFSVEILRPGSIREELGTGTNRIIRVTDGESGWIQIGSASPAPLATEDVRSMSAAADLEGPLLDYARKGHSIELFGQAQVGGRDAHKVLVRLKDRPLRTVYIDTESFLEIKWESTTLRDGREFLVESLFTDYRRVNGIMCAFRILSITAGTRIRQTLVLDRIEINPAIDASRFSQP